MHEPIIDYLESKSFIYKCTIFNLFLMIHLFDGKVLWVFFIAIEIHQTIEPDIEGRATLQLVGDYYNRNLSGWEPFLEPWGYVSCLYIIKNETLSDFPNIE